MEKRNLSKSSESLVKGCVANPKFIWKLAEGCLESAHDSTQLE
jgi:hypothetical protein